MTQHLKHLTPHNIGTVILAIALLLTIFNGIPFATKTEVNTRFNGFQREISEIREDVKAIRQHLMGESRGRGK